MEQDVRHCLLCSFRFGSLLKRIVAMLECMRNEQFCSQSLPLHFLMSSGILIEHRQNLLEFIAEYYVQCYIGHILRAHTKDCESKPLSVMCIQVQKNTISGGVWSQCFCRHRFIRKCFDDTVSARHVLSAIWKIMACGEHLECVCLQALSVCVQNTCTSIQACPSLPECIEV